MCALKNNLVLVHSPGSGTWETKKAAWTELQNTIPANQYPGIFQPIAGQGEGEGVKWGCLVSAVALAIHTHEFGGVELLKEQEVCSHINNLSAESMTLPFIVEY